MVPEVLYAYFSLVPLRKTAVRSIHKPVDLLIDQ